MSPKQNLFSTTATALLGIFLSTLLAEKPAKAATGYFFLPSSTGYTRLITDGTRSFWGTFDFPNNIANGIEVGQTSNNTANISFSGKNTDSRSNRNDRWSNNPSGTYNRWAYNNVNNWLTFYNSNSNSDSLRLILDGAGLTGSGGWIKINTISFCRDDSATASNTTCTGAANFGPLTGNAIAYIRVPSPSLFLGLTPFAVILATRFKKFKKPLLVKNTLSVHSTTAQV